jgi:hypothetical protein
MTMPSRGPYHPLRRRDTGKKTKAGEAVREYFLPVPVWTIQQGVAREGDLYEFRPDLKTGDLIFKRKT